MNKATQPIRRQRTKPSPFYFFPRLPFSLRAWQGEIDVVYLIIGRPNHHQDLRVSRKGKLEEERMAHYKVQFLRYLHPA